MEALMIIAHLSAGSILLPLYLAVSTMKYISKDLYPLVILLVISLVSDLILLILFNLSINNYVVVNLYLIIQFLICYRLLYGDAYVIDRLSIFLLTGFIIFSIVNLFFIQGTSVYNSFSNIAASFILIYLCLRYYHQLISQPPTLYIYKYPLFWISTAILIYYSSNFFLFVVNNYLTIGIDGSHQVIWVFHNIINITKNLLFAVALWHNYRNRKLSF